MVRYMKKHLAFEDASEEMETVKNQLVEVRYTGYALGETRQLTGWRDTTQTTRQEAEVAEGYVRKMESMLWYLETLRS